MRLVDLIRVDPECNPPPNSGAHEMSVITGDSITDEQMLDFCAMRALECIAIPAEQMLHDDILSGNVDGSVFLGNQAWNVITSWIRSAGIGEAVLTESGAYLQGIHYVRSVAFLPDHVAIVVPKGAGLTARKHHASATYRRYAATVGLHTTGSKARRYTLPDYIN